MRDWLLSLKVKGRVRSLVDREGWSVLGFRRVFVEGGVAAFFFGGGAAAIGVRDGWCGG